MTTPQLTLRDYENQDAPAVNAIALDAFAQFENHYADWSVFRSKIADTASLASVGELIVAVLGNGVVGAVAYVGPGRPKASFFRPEWPAMRMLVVAPHSRGLGVGRALAEECLVRARRDGAQLFALHTSPIMSVALPMYLRMGFQLHSEVPSIHGVAYNLYTKALVDA